MLTITPEASHAIRGILDASGAPPGAVFRISPQSDDGDAPGAALMMSVVDSPMPDEPVVQGEDVEVSLEPTAAAMLEDKQLEAAVVGEQINFSIAEQTG